MALSIGTIKEIKGLVIAKGMQGEERVLKVGDTLFLRIRYVPLEQTRK
ncbi:hypothetical protein [Sulfurospirillum deleyianum]|uniref:Uncharacterized protein n=1 Tax=Sulfurospirillum deleyianum (strain ATCC 51133 / DSM 6946 / 5175) TaxID=525898 RepID=D1B157_SULD5|nr:hypothetical protein [Sulfurospirillum deleyianum]ACZ11827.1 hypothetical protein Sdel_0796 [Sulfurospirillum deleyianum DSM 6946]